MLVFILLCRALPTGTGDEVHPDIHPHAIPVICFLCVDERGADCDNEKSMGAWCRTSNDLETGSCARMGSKHDDEQ